MKINFTHDLALVNGLKIPPKLLGQLNEFKIEKSNHFNLKQSITKDGYIFVRNLFDKNKIKLARDEVFMRLKEVDEIEDPYQDGIYSGRSSRDKIYTNRGEFWKSVSNGKYLREITNGKVLKKIISDIFGEPSIGFDFLFLRPVANGKFTQMHCDTSFFTRTTKKVLTCWISFTNVTIDKGPQNFIWIGFIKILYPNSFVINVTRDPFENCISCFKNYFEGGLPFTYNQKDLAIFYKNYLQTIKFWKDKLGSFIYEVKYENLITNSKNEIEKLLKFFKLNYEENCLNFHKNKSPVKTLSMIQVRQPIYKSSLNLSKKFNYKKEFSELYNELNKNP